VSVTVERMFHLANQPARRTGYRRVAEPGPEPAAPPIPKRTPRISELMALAIRCDQLIRSGAVSDITTLARLAHVTQPRMTQIMNLTLLAPEIQETLLFLPCETICGEREIRYLASLTSWRSQLDELKNITCISAIRLNDADAS
jgi:hypothetical protein